MAQSPCSVILQLVSVPAWKASLVFSVTDVTVEQPGTCQTVFRAENASTTGIVFLETSEVNFIFISLEHFIQDLSQVHQNNILTS